MNRGQRNRVQCDALEISMRSLVRVKLKTKLCLLARIVPILSVMYSAQLTPTAPGGATPSRSPAALNSPPWKHTAAQLHNAPQALYPLQMPVYQSAANTV